MGAKPDNELLRDKHQIKEEDRRTGNKKGRKEKKKVEIWSDDNNTTKEMESLSQKPPGWCHVTLS